MMTTRRWRMTRMLERALQHLQPLSHPPPASHCLRFHRLRRPRPHRHPSSPRMGDVTFQSPQPPPATRPTSIRTKHRLPLDRSCIMFPRHLPMVVHSASEVQRSNPSTPPHIYDTLQKVRLSFLTSSALLPSQDGENMSSTRRPLLLYSCSTTTVETGAPHRRPRVVVRVRE